MVLFIILLIVINYDVIFNFIKSCNIVYLKKPAKTDLDNTLFFEDTSCQEDNRYIITETSNEIIDHILQKIEI